MTKCEQPWRRSSLLISQWDQSAAQIYGDLAPLEMSGKHYLLEHQHYLER